MLKDSQLLILTFFSKGNVHCQQENNWLYVSMYDLMKKYTFSVSPQFVVPATLFQTDSWRRLSQIGYLLIIWAQKMTAKVRIMHSFAWEQVENNYSYSGI